jgi:hypothetical protein
LKKEGHKETGIMERWQLKGMKDGYRRQKGRRRRDRNRDKRRLRKDHSERVTGGS